MRGRTGLMLPWMMLAGCALSTGGLSTEGGMEPTTDSGTREAGEAGVPTSIQRVDLLVVVDNSGSMAANQTQLASKFELPLQALANPPCTSASRPTPHACDVMDPADVPIFSPVRDVHVGVVSTDLGTRANRPVIGCEVADKGDDGVLNPIRFGQATQRNPPRVRDAALYPSDCLPVEQYPSFLQFGGPGTSPTEALRDARCNMILGHNGCGLEQPLEAVTRALIAHDASDRDLSSPNARFLREDALLAILLITDEDDASVRDCRYADDPSACQRAGLDGDTVYDPRPQAEYQSNDVNLRMYLYKPGNVKNAPGYSADVGADPFWGLDRYLDPRDPHKGWLGLKCPAGATGAQCHPERVVFGAITGVPLSIPRDATNAVEWDQLLGAPGGDPNNFAQRNSSAVPVTMTAEGSSTMRQGVLDPACPTRVSPACRRRGSTDPRMCSPSAQYVAPPARRVVEMARRFDRSLHCNGAPCRNGMLASVCESDYSQAMNEFAALMQWRLLTR